MLRDEIEFHFRLFSQAVQPAPCPACSSRWPLFSNTSKIVPSAADVTPDQWFPLHWNVWRLRGVERNSLLSNQQCREAGREEKRGDEQSKRLRLLLRDHGKNKNYAGTRLAVITRESVIHRLIILRRSGDVTKSREIAQEKSSILRRVPAEAFALFVRHFFGHDQGLCPAIVRARRENGVQQRDRRSVRSRKRSGFDGGDE